MHIRSVWKLTHLKLYLIARITGLSRKNSKMWPGAVKNISQSDLMCHPLPKKHKITYSKCIVFVPVGKNLVLDPELSGNHLQLFVFTWHQLVRKKHLRRSFSLSPCFKQWPNKAPMRSRPAITTSTSGCKESPRKKFQANYQQLRRPRQFCGFHSSVNQAGLTVCLHLANLHLPLFLYNMRWHGHTVIC